MQSIEDPAYITSGPYLGCVVELSPQAAVAALDRCRLEARLRRIERNARWAVPVRWGSLELDAIGEYAEPPRPTLLWPLLRFSGQLRSRYGGYRIAVELELLPWSDERTELGLRPSGRWPPVFLRELPYYRHGAEALDRLAQEMIEWAAAFEESEERVA